MERLQGLEGLVEVEWELRGDHNLADIRPLSGRIQFADGNNTAVITLFILADSVSELDEATEVVLTQVVQSGVPPGGDSMRGAEISSTRHTAVITVLANDNPYGLFTWSTTSVSISEPDDGNSVSQFTIVRQAGTLGSVEVTYSTLMRTDGQEYNRATSGSDYELTSGTLVVLDGITSASVSVNILSDTSPEDDEVFYINITSVRLLNQSSSISMATPVVGNPLLEVTISANDDANGVVEFDLNRVSTYIVHTVRTHTHTHTCPYTYLHTWTRMHMHKHTHTHTYTYKHKYLHIHTSAHAHVSTHTCGTSTLRPYKQIAANTFSTPP